MLGLAAVAGCARSPLADARERDLRDSVIHSVRRELAEAGKYPAVLVTERDFGPERLGIDPELMPQLEKMGGPQAYDRHVFPLDKDLLGREETTIGVAMDRAVRAAASYNLEIQFQRLAPAISEAQAVAAEAAFDWTLFGEGAWSNIDDPRINPVGGNSLNADQRIRFDTGLGVRRRLTTGGEFTIEQSLNYSDLQENPASQFPNPENSVSIALQYNQPLLRGFGSDVALAPVRLAINAERGEIAGLKARMIATVTETETAYWALVRAQWDLLILQHLLEMGIETAAKTEARKNFDAGPAQRADAKSEVEERRGFVIAAQEVYRRASDDLKRLMNDPDLPVGSEVLIFPIDVALDAPIRYNLLDAYTTAIKNRPEIEQAILSIDDASIRLEVADNARLPQLDLRLQTRFAGMEDNLDQAYSDLFEGDFVSYLAGLVFEQPIGNRGPEAFARARRLERAQANIAYRDAVQNVINEVKNELRRVVTGYKLIEQTRLARLAAAESLRSFQVEMELQLGFTVANLEIWFNRQTQLAEAERREMEVLADYNISLARLHAAMGTALARNNIEFVVPDAPYATR